MSKESYCLYTEGIGSHILMSDWYNDIQYMTTMYYETYVETNETLVCKCMLDKEYAKYYFKNETDMLLFKLKYSHCKLERDYAERNFIKPVC